MRTTDSGQDSSWFSTESCRELSSNTPRKGSGCTAMHDSNGGDFPRSLLVCETLLTTLAWDMPVSAFVNFVWSRFVSFKLPSNLSSSQPIGVTRFYDSGCVGCIEFVSRGSEDWMRLFPNAQHPAPDLRPLKCHARGELMEFSYQVSKYHRKSSNIIVWCQDVKAPWVLGVWGRLHHARAR